MFVGELEPDGLGDLDLEGLGEDFPSDFVGPLQPGDTRDMPVNPAAGVESVYQRFQATQSQPAPLVAQPKPAPLPAAASIMTPGVEAVYNQFRANPPATAAQKAQVAADVASVERRLVSTSGVAGISWLTLVLAGGAVVLGVMMLSGGGGGKPSRRRRASGRRKSTRRRTSARRRYRG